MVCCFSSRRAVPSLADFSPFFLPSRRLLRTKLLVSLRSTLQLLFLLPRLAPTRHSSVLRFVLLFSFLLPPSPSLARADSSSLSFPSLRALRKPSPPRDPPAYLQHVSYPQIYNLRHRAHRRRGVVARNRKTSQLGGHVVRRSHSRETDLVQNAVRSSAGRLLAKCVGSTVEGVVLLDLEDSM